MCLSRAQCVNGGSYAEVSLSSRRVFADRAASPQQSADKAGSQGWDDLWKAMAIAAWDLGVEELRRVVAWDEIPSLAVTMHG